MDAALPNDHDIILHALPRNPEESTPLGNGRLTAMIHVPGPEMVWQLNACEHLA